MNDFIVTIKDSDRGPWPVPDKESVKAISRWASGQRPGTVFVFRALKKLSNRSDQQHGLYRLRNQILAPALDTDSESLHDFIKSELDFVEEYQIAGKPQRRLRSQRDLTKEEMSAMINFQDNLAHFVNDGRDPEGYLILPKSE